MYTTVILAMLGKIGAAAAFAVIYVWSAELYPTVVRNVGMGASSSCARIGGMVSPYIADLVSSYDTKIGGAPERGGVGLGDFVLSVIRSFTWLIKQNNECLSSNISHEYS